LFSNFKLLKFGEQDDSANTNDLTYVLYTNTYMN